MKPKCAAYLDVADLRVRARARALVLVNVHSTCMYARSVQLPRATLVQTLVLATCTCTNHARAPNTRRAKRCVPIILSADVRNIIL